MLTLHDMSIVGLYVLAFLLLARVDRHRAGTPEGFFFNHRASGTTEVTFSMPASCVGGSATLGLCGLTRILNQTFKKSLSFLQTIKPPKSAKDFGGFR